MLKTKSYLTPFQTHVKNESIRLRLLLDEITILNIYIYRLFDVTIMFMDMKHV